MFEGTTRRYENAVGSKSTFVSRALVTTLTALFERPLAVQWRHSALIVTASRAWKEVAEGCGAIAVAWEGYERDRERLHWRKFVTIFVLQLFTKCGYWTVTSCCLRFPCSLEASLPWQGSHFQQKPGEGVYYFSKHSDFCAKCLVFDDCISNSLSVIANYFLGEGTVEVFLWQFCERRTTFPEQAQWLNLGNENMFCAGWAGSVRFAHHCNGSSMHCRVSTISTSARDKRRFTRGESRKTLSDEQLKTVRKWTANRFWYHVLCGAGKHNGNFKNVWFLQNRCYDWCAGFVYLLFIVLNCSPESYLWLIGHVVIRSAFWWKIPGFGVCLAKRVVVVLFSLWKGLALLLM